MQQARARAASSPRPDPWRRIDATTWTWDDLVLPPEALAQLQAMPALLSERYWTGSEGVRRGVLLLFAGSAGTGKTMAAQVLASALGLPILRADLEAVFARGRGEASRLLARLFATAQRLGAVLELDRGEPVLSSAVASERPPSMRIAAADLRDLLERCEGHPGVVVFPTARTREIDELVRARFDAVVEFPFPEASQRAEIWRRALPAGSAVSDADLDEVAGAFQLPGAAIAACAARADRLAAVQGSSVGLVHIGRALEDEYATRLVSDHTRGALAALRERTEAPGPGGVPEPRAVEPVILAQAEPVPAGAEASAKPEVEPGSEAEPEPEPPDEAQDASEPGVEVEGEAQDAPEERAEPQPDAYAPQPTGEAASEFFGVPIDDVATDRLVRTMAAVAAEAAAPEPRPASRRGRRARRLIPLLLLGIVSAIVLGLAAAKQHNATRVATASQPPPDQVLTTRVLTVRYPGGWQRQAAPAIHGLTLRYAVALSAGAAPTGRLVVGFGTGHTPGNPLPARFIAATLPGAPTEQIVILGPHHFYRVLDPRLSLGSASQSVYALSTASGPVIAVCQTSSQAFTAECERVLATLHVTARPSPSGPSPSRAYASALSGVLNHLDHARSSAARDLALARTPAEQARAASRLAGLHAQAASQVAGLHAGSAAAANATLARALRDLADAYGTLGRAALHDDAHGYKLGQADATRAASAVSAALSKLAGLGYSVR